MAKDYKNKKTGQIITSVSPVKIADSGKWVDGFLFMKHGGDTIYCMKSETFLHNFEPVVNSEPSIDESTIEAMRKIFNGFNPFK